MTAAGLSSSDRPDDREQRFLELYERTARAVYEYVIRRVPRSSVDANDVVADIYATAWRRIDDVPDPPDDRLWLFGVARRFVARATRAVGRRERLYEKLRVGAEPQRVTDGGTDADLAEVYAALASLRSRDREVLLLVVWDGLTHAEAGSVLGCSANAVGVRLHRARARLGAALGLTQKGRGRRAAGIRPSLEMTNEVM